MKYVVALAAVLLCGAPLAAADRASETESVHLALAEAYDVQVRELEAVLAEHRKMRDEGAGRFFVDDRATPAASLAGLDGLYGRVIGSAQRLKDDLLELAAWHRARASELRGP